MIDEYPVIIGKFGTPVSLISTENDEPKPKIPTRIAKYPIVKIVMVPAGCVSDYEAALRALNDAGRYPALAESESTAVPACIPFSDVPAWTIVGYIDQRSDAVISAERAAELLSAK